MKIGILTQPLHANYGGVLQNYALQTVLKRMGHEVWTIDYNKYTWFNWFNNAWRILAHKMIGHNVKFSRTPKGRNAIERPLRRFILKNISLTVPRSRYVEYQIVKKYAFDAIVVGSDQVWRPKYNCHIDRMFLSFCDDRLIKRIAFAASFGTDEWEFTTEQTNVCKPLAQRFDSVSVREESGVRLCREHFNVDATHVLDPTLLLSVEDYTKLCADIPRRDPFVFAYTLDQSEEKVNEIKSFAKRKGLPFLIQSAGPNITKNDSIELWLSHFRDAAYVITDSFHGTVFSIIFGKEFFVFGNKGRGNSRFDSLLGLFGLQNRVIEGTVTCDTDICWEIIQKKLAEEYKKSISWLQEVLR